MLQIANLTGLPRTSIRTALIENGVELRVFKRSSLKVDSIPKNSSGGGSPYGYGYQNGKLVPDKKEQRVVMAIYALWKKGMTLKSIVELSNTFTPKKYSPV